MASEVERARVSYREHKAFTLFKGSAYGLSSMDGSVDIKGKPVNMSTSGRWRATRILMAAEVLERIAFLGIASNLVMYLTTQLHEGTASSATNIYNWQGASFLLPLVGAFIADTYWGRFWTMINFSCLYVLGMFILTLAVSIKSLKPPPCNLAAGTKCAKAMSGQVGFFWLALVFVAIALGGVKPVMAPLGADQFDEYVPKERHMKVSFFNYWFVCLNVGALVTQTALVYVQDNVGWGWGFGLPTAGYALALVIMLCGIPYYRHKLPGGSPMTYIAQVLVAAARNYKATVPSDKSLLYGPAPDTAACMGKGGAAAVRPQTEHTQSLKFLEKASIVAPPAPDGKAEKQARAPTLWKLCPLTQVEAVKQVVRLLPLWLVFAPVGAVPAQLATFYTRQGRSMDGRVASVTIPAASMQCVTTLTLLVSIPLYDGKVVPFVRRLTGVERGLTPLQRIGVGMFMSVLVMVVAALTEAKRLEVVVKHGLLDKPNDVVPMTIMWLLPQYILTGFMEVFLAIGQLEFFYDQAPEGMRSLGNLLFLADIGAGNFWASGMVKLVVAVTGRNGRQRWIVNDINRCRLDYFYWFLAAQMALAACVYLVIANWFEYKVDHTHAHAEIIRASNVANGSDAGLQLISAEKMMRPGEGPDLQGKIDP